MAHPWQIDVLIKHNHYFHVRKLQESILQKLLY